MEETSSRGQRPNRRRLGMERESMAARYLETKGLELLDRNFRCRAGEIDLIMRDASFIVFVEVKYRSSSAKGFPEEAVGPSKMKTIRFVARDWLHIHRYSDMTPCRFDVVSIMGEDIRWIKNAF